MTAIVATGRALYENEGWVQILADVLERPVVRSPVEESSARGAAAVALARLGHEPPPPPDGEAVPPRRERFEAHRAARARLADLRTALAGTT